MEGLGNFEIPTTRLKDGSSASELKGPWYPNLDSNQEFLQGLSLLRMPFRH